MRNPEIDDSYIVGELNGLFPGLSQIRELDDSFGYTANRVKTAVLDGIEIAIKPFKYFAKERAEHEALMLDIVSDLDIPTLKPLSISLGNFGNYLVTKYDRDIDPLDQVVCGHCPTERLQFLAGKIGSTISKLHEGGVIHGDCQLKNLFINGNDEIGIMDFEQSELHLGERDRDYYLGCDYDIETLAASSEQVMCSNNTGDFISQIQTSYFGELDQAA